MSHTLIEFDQISLDLGGHKLLSEADFQLHESERVCLIGRNGAGKSTLFKLIMGQLQADTGEIRFRQQVTISQLEQSLPSVLNKTTLEIIYEGLAARQDKIRAYEALSAASPSQAELQQMEVLQHEIEALGGWDLKKEVETVVTQLNLPTDKKLSELSGGWQRRVLLGKALVSRPKVLLLDEPTNHLDISTIEWLEHTVRGFSGSVLFITHDRLFLQKLATRILELDRGKLVSWDCDYKTYLKRKAQAMEVEEKENALFDKRLAQEEAWIRQGIKARRTRNEGRVRSLMAMREEHAARIKPQGKAKIAVQKTESSGKKVIDAKNVSFTFGGDAAPVVNKFSIKIRRGDRIGIIGNNGVGKSTLINLLLGEIAPSSGTVKLGTQLEVAYFSQLRSELNPDKTIAENVGDGRDYITINGKDRHVVGYLKDFLFTPKRSLTLVRALSGGERNRVLLAKVFAKPANLLVLDEPTNDLDVEMLEALEERLLAYEGTLILVSHDRVFLDNVVTSTLVFETENRVEQYVGGYSDWLKHGRELAEVENPYKKKNEALKAAVQEKRETEDQADQQKVGIKLSYKLQRELDAIPGQIEQLEQEVNLLKKEIESPEFYDQDYTKIQPLLDELASKQQTLDELMDRWLALEAMQSGED